MKGLYEQQSPETAPSGGQKWHLLLTWRSDTPSPPLPRLQLLLGLLISPGGLWSSLDSALDSQTFSSSYGNKKLYLVTLYPECMFSPGSQQSLLQSGPGVYEGFLLPPSSLVRRWKDERVALS